MKIFKVITLPLFFILIFASLAHAVIYKWTDDEGVVHFSNEKEYIPEKYYDRSEKIIFYGEEKSNGNDISSLTQINVSKEQNGFEDISFGITVDEFLKLTSGASLIKYVGNEKNYSIGNGYRLIGTAKVKVTYCFVDENLEEVVVLYSGTDEDRILNNLSRSLGEPDFKKFPFVYWFYSGLELKFRKDEDYFSIFKKKIKKF